MSNKRQPWNSPHFSGGNSGTSDFSKALETSFWPSRTQLSDIRLTWKEGTVGLLEEKASLEGHLREEEGSHRTLRLWGVRTHPDHTSLHLVHGTLYFRALASKAE